MSLIDDLRRHRLLAIVRGEGAERTASVLAEAGVPLIEISLTAPGAEAAIGALRDGGLPVGAGTVVTRDDAARAADAGAAFVVTPGLGPGATEAVRLGLPVLCGVLTPSEVNAALDLPEVVALKLFPASVGGPDYLAALRQPYPNVPFVPVGGVDADAARRYLEAGAVAVGVGGPLVGDGEPAGLRKRAAAFRAALGQAPA